MSQACRWNLDHRDCSFGDIPDVCSLQALVELLPAVGPSSEAFAIGYVNGLAVVARFHPSGKPAGGDVSQNLAAVGIEHRQRINARAGHVEPLLVGAER